MTADHSGIFPWMHHWLCDPFDSYTGQRGRAYAGDGALSVSGHFYSRIMGKQLDSLVYGHAWNLMKVSGRLVSQKVTEKMNQFFSVIKLYGLFEGI